MGYGMVEEWTLADEELKKKIKKLCDLEEGLSQWEVNFVDDMMTKVKEGQKFSPRQTGKITQLYIRLC